MEPNTTGQRIAQRRKMLGLSQEALGQELGVSRQAISKWESDAATPEINKLIALSHLFSVSVGWLLCEEAMPGPGSQDAFTEEQLRLLEKVLRKQPATPLWQKVLVVVMVLCSAASLLLSLRANHRADDAHTTYREQISWLYENYGGAQSQLDGISAQLRDLQSQDDIFADYDFSAVAWPEWKGADITFVGNPRQWNESDTGTLIVLRDGAEIARAQAVWDGFRVSATVALEKQNDLEYHFIRQSADGSGSQQELRASGYPHLIGMLSFSTHDRVDACHILGGALYLTDYSFSVSYPQIPPRANTAQWEKMDLVLLHNNAEVWRKSVSDLLSAHNETLTEAVSTADEDYWSARLVSLNIRQGELVIELPELQHGDKLSLQVDSVFRAGEQRTPFTDELHFWYYQNGKLE